MYKCKFAAYVPIIDDGASVLLLCIRAPTSSWNFLLEHKMWHFLGRPTAEDKARWVFFLSVHISIQQTCSVSVHTMFYGVMQCSGGTFSAAGASACTSCSPGKYLTNASGETDLKSCTTVSTRPHVVHTGRWHWIFREFILLQPKHSQVVSRWVSQELLCFPCSIYP